MKNAFTTELWEKALTAVFVRSISDPEYRELCLNEPRAAVEAEVPDLALPADFHFRFAAHQRDVHPSYLLPPMIEDGTSTVAYAQVLIARITPFITHAPTNKVCPNPYDPNCGLGATPTASVDDPAN